MPPMPDEIEAAVNDAVRDESVKVMILRGAGRAFCGGFNFGAGFHHWDKYPTTDLATILDGLMRNTADAKRFIGIAERDGVRAAIAERDSPFGDYSQAPKGEQPDPRNVIEVKAKS
jgi:enoyl-CoA hydratase/carnithine racemase